MIKLIYYSIISGLIFIAVREIFNIFKAYMELKTKKQEQKVAPERFNKLINELRNNINGGKE